MTLAEIIQEIERAEALVAKSDLFVDRFDEYRNLESLYRKHGPRLLAVARAAVEMKRASDAAWPILMHGPGGTMEEITAETRLLEAEDAFDDAAKERP